MNRNHGLSALAIVGTFANADARAAEHSGFHAGIESDGFVLVSDADFNLLSASAVCRF